MQCLKDGVRICRMTFRSGRWLWACHSSTKLFVGGLSYDTNEAVLKDAFGRHGEIIEAVKVICDHVNGRSKGYGFVRFTSETTATIALKEMDGQMLDGRNIRVHYAHRGSQLGSQVNCHGCISKSSCVSEVNEKLDAAKG